MVFFMEDETRRVVYGFAKGAVAAYDFTRARINEGTHESPGESPGARCSFISTEDSEIQLRGFRTNGRVFDIMVREHPSDPSISS